MILKLNGKRNQIYVSLKILFRTSFARFVEYSTGGIFNIDLTHFNQSFCSVRMSWKCLKKGQPVKFSSHQRQVWNFHHKTQYWLKSTISCSVALTLSFLIFRSTSTINGIAFVPFMSVDLRERFAFPVPFSWVAFDFRFFFAQCQSQNMLFKLSHDSYGLDLHF